MSQVQCPNAKVIAMSQTMDRQRALWSVTSQAQCLKTKADCDVMSQMNRDLDEASCLEFQVSPKCKAKLIVNSQMDGDVDGARCAELSLQMQADCDDFSDGRRSWWM